MPGDFSRKTFKKIKPYSGVLMQQGRVQLDADWNEQLEIQHHRTETETKDVIGLCGVPKKNDSFKISITPDGNDLVISPGRIYTDGLLCELEASPVPINFVPSTNNQVTVPHMIVDGKTFQEGQWIEISAANKQEKKLLKITSLNSNTGILTFNENITEFKNEGAAAIRRIATYSNQPYYPNPDYTYFVTSPLTSPPASPPISFEFMNLNDGTYLVFLDVWQREINYLDDPLIQEKALGETDTATRIQNVWQVKLLAVTPEGGGKTSCKSNFTEWNNYTAPNSGMLNARTKAPDPQKDPCILPPSSGFRGLENQLYRVEIHKEGDRDTATFKWSRDNATVETKIEKIEGSIVTVLDIGKDEILGFAGDQWVEIIDDESTLKGSPNSLVQIDKIDPTTREITMKTSVAAHENKPNLKLRRWDQTGTTAKSTGIDMPNDWIELENGIEVKFSEGSYNPGDFWLIPARTAIGDIEWPPYEIPNTNPIAQPPTGIQHHYCRLALLEVVSGSVILEDCRELFPTLTDISAEDVDFDNSKCKMPQAETVQDALDSLCDARDLRHHNKHLHGYGVVCGLKVKCGPDRKQVVVENGYALDCEGNGIHVDETNSENGIVYDVVAEAENNGLLDSNGDGNVCLTIDGSTSQSTIISVEQHVQQGLWDDILEGTLLKDFYQDCIESFLNFLKKNITFDLSDTPPISISQRRLTAFINLISQVINSASGPYAFLSGKKEEGGRNEECGEGTDEKRYEDKLLWCFYNDLKDFIESETFCAMFDEDREFPEYTIDPGLETIFGSALKLHHRLKLHPSGKFAYTCGFGNKIYVYDLETREMIQASEFPASKNIQIQDLAVSEEMLYAVGVLDDKDSIFAVAKVKSDGTLEWGPTSVSCGSKYVRLGIITQPQIKLYAIKKAHGLYIIKDIGTPGFTADLVRSFNATGLLEISDDGTQGFAATDNSTAIGTESSTFDNIIIVNLISPSSAPQYFAVQGDNMANDILFYNNVIYVTGNPAPGHTKTLWGLNISTSAQYTVNLLENTSTRLDVGLDTQAGSFILVTLADKFKVVRISLDSHTLDTGFRIPVQLFPLDIEVSAEGNMGYVLNFLVNTLTEINIDTVFDTTAQPNFTQEPPNDIWTYRMGVQNAFEDLASHFLQYLKDCFCDKFLIDCPQCTEDDNVYLGAVEIRERHVYNICNFTKRHYVKSFRTWGYWLSTVPILPLIKHYFAKLCCSVFQP